MLKSDVTVVIPTHNRASLLSRSVQSVLNQTHTDFELIIVDDFSQDNTEETVKNFNDQRIRYIRHELNRGVSAARNTGINNSNSKYLAFLDDDDEYMSDFLKKQIQAIANSPKIIGVVYSIIRSQYDQVYGQSIFKKQGYIYKDILRLQFDTPIQSLLIKRDCLHTAGLFDENLKLAEDIDMCIRLSKFYHFIHVDEPLILKHFTDGAICTDLDQFIDGFKILINKHLHDLKKDGYGLSQMYLHIGYFLHNNHRINESKIYIYKAMKAYPFNKKAVAAGILLSLNNNWYQRISYAYLKRKYPLKEK